MKIFITLYGKNELKTRNDSRRNCKREYNHMGYLYKMKNGVTGLLYVEDISISRIKTTPNERFEIGQKVNKLW